MQESALKREKYWRYFAKRQRSDKLLSSDQQGKDQKYFRLREQLPEGGALYDISEAPFYTLFNVGSYSFSPFKVVWQMGANQMKAAVVSTHSFSVRGKSTPPQVVIPCTGTTSYVSFQVGAEAHYVCALMNSSLVGALLKSFSSEGRGFGAPSILSNIAVPRFNSQDRTHEVLSQLSVQAHELTAANKTDGLAKIVFEIDQAAAELWGITSNELEQIPTPL